MPGIQNPTSMATFAAAPSSLSNLSLPQTTLSFWLYISSQNLQQSLQTVLSTVSVPTKRFTISSIMTSFAQFQHVIGSIVSSADPESIAYFESFLMEELNLTPAKIERRRAQLRNAMIESLTALIIEHTSDKKTKGYILGSCGKYVHPAVREARALLRELIEEDDFERDDYIHIRGMRAHARNSTDRKSSSLTSLTENSLVLFLDVEEYVLRSEFTAFKKDIVGPNGKGPHDRYKPKSPPTGLIQYLRVYHDGLLTVDSKQTYSPNEDQHNSPKSPALQPHRLSTASVQSGTMSYLEKQFLEALQILPPSSPQVGAGERRGSVASTYSFYAQYVEKEKEKERRQQTRGLRERKFRDADGDWDREDEFYREALRYDLR